MLALIMAGGAGSRLGMGEKPLVTICGKPMIAYVLEAFATAGHETVVVASPRTPYTRNWCRVRGVDLYEAGGAGYIEDLEEVAGALDLAEPVFTCVADLPCLTAETIRALPRLGQAGLLRLGAPRPLPGTRVQDGVHRNGGGRGCLPRGHQYR
jgi:adenosylcobinamide-phosphate guanylyltransferase